MSIFTKTKQRFRRKRLFDLGIIPKEIDTAKLYDGDHGWVVDYSKLNSNSVEYSDGN